jgi:hypothetical protein
MTQLRLRSHGAATLQRAYEESSRYTYHIANTRNLLSGGPYAAQ